jgi:lactoylglutathione lyase
MHNNFNVLDLQKSIAFYKEALGLIELRRIEAPDKSFTIAFLGDGRTSHQLELTWLSDRTEPYDLGDNEIHLAMCVENITEALKKHKNMGCVCFENKAMGIYFIEDPDGYWIEIIPKRKG